MARGTSASSSVHAVESMRTKMTLATGASAAGALPSATEMICTSAPDAHGCTTRCLLW
jgi:hypothetical protein|tara:strand:+ start:827 stop:1000 length:174 start_codon:yes stop_codon:yes gene_type:complete